MIIDSVHILKSAIQGWLDASKSNSIQRLADKTGMTYKAVRSIANGDTKDPDYKNILKILIEIRASKETINSLNSSIFGESHYVTSVFENGMSPNEKALEMFDYGCKISKVIDHPLAYYIVTKLANTPMTREEITKKLGDEGIEHLNKIIELEIALPTKEDREKLYVPDFWLSAQFIKTCIEHQLKYVTQEKLDANDDTLLNLTFKCSLENLHKLNTEVKEFTSAKIKEIEDTGDLDVFYSLQTGTFQSHVEGGQE